MNTTLIRIQLLNGDPEGLRSASIAGRTTEVSGCSWTDLPKLLIRNEATRPAVYFLVGTPLQEDGANSLPEAIYIGECDALRDRFGGKHHKQDSADWSQIFVASETGDTFNKAHARLAEHLLKQRAVDANRANVLTQASSAGNVSDGDRAFTLEFVENVVTLAQVLGVSLFRPTYQPIKSKSHDQNFDQSAVSDEQRVWTYKYGKAPVHARMIQDGKQFVVLRGSTVRPTEDPLGSYFGKTMRTRAIESGVLVKNEETGVYVFAQDFPTPSLSAAAATIYGQNATGPDAWYDLSTSQTYREWIAARTTAAASVVATDDA